ncbi:MAG: GIY-YIG nuclease family protein [Patescibacteria group bacterium]|nr:GIY-YIG nuclease family protein [Patescibacteria group bacterium]
MHFVYILKCADTFNYVGCTNNIEDRLERHSKGQVEATKSRLPIELVSYVAFENKYKAYEFEKYLKSGSGRAFIKKHLA